MVLGEQVAENASFPEQTLGVSVSATPDGTYAAVYVVSDTRTARIRRYDAAGPVDPGPVEFFGDVGSDYIPYTSLFSPADEPTFLFLAVPSFTPENSLDLRLARTTLGSDDVTLGPELSQLVPEFPGGAKDVAGLAGSPEHVVVLWEEIERQQNCGCTIPPPVRIEFLAQLVLASNPPEAIGAPFTVYLWEEGDPIGPPVTEPVLAP